MKNFELYRGGAKRIRNRWSRGYRDDFGGVCLVQSVLDEAGISGQTLPAHMVEEIDASLQQFRSYRVMRAIDDLVDGGLGRQDVIMAWNDLMGSKRRVARVLDTLADGQELEFLRAEQLRLQIEVQQLKDVVEELRSEKRVLERAMAELQAKNGRLRRWMNVATLASDRRELSRLDEQLDARWEQLTQTQEALTADCFAPLAGV